MLGRNAGGRKANIEKRAGRAFLLELHGRHRFFLNQLLQIYFRDEKYCSDELDSIRLGAAAMVSGSMLGQYLAGAVEKVEGRQETCSDEVTGSFLETPFWHLLEQWRTCEWNSSAKGLHALDRLLVQGV